MVFCCPLRPSRRVITCCGVCSVLLPMITMSWLPISGQSSAMVRECTSSCHSASRASREAWAKGSGSSNQSRLPWMRSSGSRSLWGRGEMSRSRLKEKTEPLPSSDSNRIWPPICCTSFWVMTRPRPVPP
ncbi:hypothetical protein D3C76_1297760 [compost metagenome]